MSLYSALHELYSRYNKSASAAYEVSQLRSKVTSLLSKGIKALLETQPFGLESFTDAYLGAIGSKYLIIDFSGPAGYTSYQKRLVLRTVEIRETPHDDRPGVCDVATGEVLGRVTQWWFRGCLPYGETEFDDRSKRTWRMSVYPLVLPLAGPVEGHPYGQNLISIAKRILADEHQISVVRELDLQLEECCADMESYKSQILNLATAHLAGGRHAELVSTHPALVHDIKTMDFTYDEADRPSQEMGKQELRIRAALSSLALDDAIAFLVTLKPLFWRRAFSYLCRHPGLVALARTAAA